MCMLCHSNNVLFLVPPFIINSPQRVLRPTRLDTLTIDCEVAARPEPLAQLILDNGTIVYQAHTNIFSYDFENIAFNASGGYSCHFDNGIPPPLFENFTIRVIGKQLVQ